MYMSINLTEEEKILNQIQNSIDTKKDLLEDKDLLKQINSLAQSSLQALKNGGKIILAGNGGSFADAQHLSAEFTSRFMFDRAPLASLALGTNNSAISAIGNDYGYEKIFSRELESIANSDDIFIPISTSGNSSNIIEAIKVANKKNVRVMALTGGTGGKLKDLCECMCVPSADTARIQECHIMIGHIVCGLVEENYFK
jgi:D-sedoheptulose 7-phosphate isomerase|tara:strand:- start:540 stop:1136 length:597 start_codon:yes stop_codon:yes gene_type:complete